MEIKKADGQNHLRVNALWNAVGNLVYLALQWLITIFVVRQGGYVDAGYLSLAMSITGTFQNISHFGIRNYQVSDIREKYSDGDYISVRFITCSVSLLLCLGFVVFSSYQKVQAVSILCFMAFRIIESISDVFQGIAQKYGRLDIVGRSFLLRGIIGFIAFCISYLGTKHLWFSILMMTIFSGISMMLYDYTRIVQLSWKKEKCFRRQFTMLKECYPLCVYMLIFAAILTLPRLYLEKLLGAELLGIYASVFTPAILVQAGVSYFYVPLVSVFAERYEKQNINGFWSLFKNMTLLMLAGFLVIYFLGVLAGDKVLLILIGEKIRGYEYLLQGILLCTILTAYTNFLCAIVTIIRELKLLVVGNIIAFFCAWIASPLFIQRFGLKGTSYALIIPLALLTVFFWFIIRVKLQKLNASA